jgi:hypothetical protein
MFDHQAGIILELRAYMIIVGYFEPCIPHITELLVVIPLKILWPTPFPLFGSA